MRANRIRRIGLILVLALAGCGGVEAIEGNIPPAAVILLPLAGADLVAADTVVFTAALSDDSTSALELEVVWTWVDSGEVVRGTAGLEGNLSTLTLDESLPPGAYAVRVVVTDRRNAEGGDVSEFEVVAAEIPDADLDGYGDAGFGGADCDDADRDVHPDGFEECNGKDDNCDGVVDEGVDDTWYADGDGDGWGDPDRRYIGCLRPGEHSDEAGDCDDQDAAVSPAAIERCNAVDDDCDGLVDEGDQWYQDLDADGRGDSRELLVGCDPAVGGVTDSTDCHDDDPELGWCRSCLEVLDFDPGAADGIHLLARPDETLYPALCDQSAGGWTLVAVNTWGAAVGVPMWDLRMLEDASAFPEPYLIDQTPAVDQDLKSPAWVHAPFTDVRFANDGEHATYLEVGDGLLSWRDFQRSIPPANCEADGYQWPMADGGTLTGGYLCDTSLYVHPANHAVPPNQPSRCQPASVLETGWGPTWSAAGYLSCPLTHPRTASFANDDLGVNPWGQASPLRMWVR